MNLSPSNRSQEIPTISTQTQGCTMINVPYRLMYLLRLLLLLIFFLSLATAQTDQSTLPNQEPDENTVSASYRPSIAVVVGIIAVMISLTFILVLYAKFCPITASDFFNQGENENNQQGLLPRRSRFSGIEKSVIDRLPFFQFSLLKGSKEGLECAVCLSKFEATDVLRLLPKCKHAFHIDCIDQWLESHSSCPLCRRKVDVHDLNTFTYSNSLRFLSDPSDLREPDIELFVEREPDSVGTSSRFSIGSSFRFTDKAKNEEFLTNDEQRLLHKFKHKIIVSDVVLQNRWSDVNSSDLMALNSEMINADSSKRFNSLDLSGILEDGSFINERIFNSREEMDKKRILPLLPKPNTSSAVLIPSGKRSMSEITNVSRFMDFGSKNRIKDPSTSANNEKEEKVRRLWLPIARRTINWFVGREQTSETRDDKEPPNA